MVKATFTINLTFVLDLSVFVLSVLALDLQLFAGLF